MYTFEYYRCIEQTMDVQKMIIKQFLYRIASHHPMFSRWYRKRDEPVKGEKRTVQTFLREVRRAPAKAVTSSATAIWKRSKDYSTLVIGKCRYAVIGSGLYMPLVDIDGAMNPYDIVEIGITGWL